MSNSQLITRKSYEVPEVVEKYIQRNALTPKDLPLVEKFASLMTGKKILDLGCGPGHYAYIFAEKGFQVTGLDYSEEMIRRAKIFRKVNQMPVFMAGDMRKLPEYFTENEFDGVWAAASLLHIPRLEIDGVLAGLRRITKNHSPIFITLKSGEGSHLVTENHLEGQVIQREFMLWTQAEFVAKAAEFGLKLIESFSREGRVFQGKPAIWLQLIFRIEKVA